MADLHEQPFDIQTFPAERSDEAPNKLIVAIHGGVGHACRQATLEALGIRDDQVPPGFRLFAKCNEDFASTESSLQVARDLTNPEAVEKMIEAGYIPINVHSRALELVESNVISVLTAKNSRTVLDGNRFANVSDSGKVTPTMHPWIMGLEKAKELGGDLLKALHQIERKYIELVLSGWKPGQDWRVFYLHTYGPRGLDPKGETIEEMYLDLMGIYNDPQRFENQHLRTEGQSFLTVDGTGQIIGPEDISQYLRENFERLGIHFPPDTEYKHHPDKVPASKWSQDYPGAFVMTETRRDLFLPARYRSPGGFRQHVARPDEEDLPLDSEQVPLLSLPISAALLLNSIRNAPQ